MDVTANTAGLNCLAVVAWGQCRYPDILYYRPAAHTNRFLWPTLEALSVAHSIKWAAMASSKSQLVVAWSSLLVLFTNHRRPGNRSN